MRSFVALTLALIVTCGTAEARPSHHYQHRHYDAPARQLFLDVAAIPAYQPDGSIGRRVTAPLSLRHRDKAHRVYYASGGGLSGACRQAARMGGPCGCHTAETLLGTSEHVYHGINVWLADGWLAFRRVSVPQPGDAAIWVHRHVAPIVAVDGTTVTVADYFGTRTVRMAGLVFVDPRSR